MQQIFTEISPDLFLFPDTCNVYLIRRGDCALAVDFGSGHVLDHLGQLGIGAVDAVLHTHHHRDQAEGDRRAVEAGVPIHVPSHERHLFDQVEIFWATKQLYDVYNVRNTYFALTESVPVAGVLEDYGVFSWEGLEIRILPTPGHTLGSVTLLCTIDGVRAAMVGDLIHSPGKVHSLFDLQYSYGALDGIEATVLSLNHLEEQQPDLLCPSHGTVMSDPDAAFRQTKENLRRFYRLGTGG
jgi:glyoxylase-like metal-dependent hydrolase (beta-lactamase superfamily II)